MLPPDNADNIYMVGTSRGDFDGHTNSGGDGAFIVKFDSNGNKIWSKLIGTSKYDEAGSVSTDSAGNIYMVGHSWGNFDGHYNNSDRIDAFIVKFDSNGNKIWSKLMGTSVDDYSYGISTDSVGNIYMVGASGGDFDGHSNSNSGNNDAFIVKFDSSGNKIWSKLMGTSGNDGASDVSTDSVGNIYMVGTSNDDFDGHSNSGSYDAFIVKFDSSGNKIWSKLMGGSGADNVSTDNSGNIYMVGVSDGFDTHTSIGGGDALIVKLDSSGNKIWSKLMGISKYDSARGSNIDSAGNIYMVGYSDGNFDGHTNSGDRDAYIVKFGLGD